MGSDLQIRCLCEVEVKFVKAWSHREDAVSNPSNTVEIEGRVLSPFDALGRHSNVGASLAIVTGSPGVTRVVYVSAAVGTHQCSDQRRNWEHGRSGVGRWSDLYRPLAPYHPGRSCSNGCYETDDDPGAQVRSQLRRNLGEFGGSAIIFRNRDNRTPVSSGRSCCNRWLRHDSRERTIRLPVEK